MKPAAPEPPREVSRLGRRAGRAFLGVEVIAYVVLAGLLAFGVALGVLSAVLSLIGAARQLHDLEGLVEATDQILFVLMLVEILHTVRVSFRAGILAAEPFLIVGLIASIRRILVITLESSRISGPAKWTAQSEAMLNASMIELGVLGALILIMVVSIAVLRRNRAEAEA